MPAEQEVIHPDWNRLFEVAEAQKGYFTTQQAAAVGYSPQLVAHHLHAGRFARALRGVYRLVHFPASEHEELAVAWLWSNGEGIVSHQTALALHDLSDALPAGIHLTLPSAWKKRRLRVPEGMTLHHADVPTKDVVWFGPAPVTAPRRTLSDCARAGLSPELLKQAARQALRRGLVTNGELVDVEDALKPFGGLGA